VACVLAASQSGGACDDISVYGAVRGAAGLMVEQAAEFDVQTPRLAVQHVLAPDLLAGSLADACVTETNVQALPTVHTVGHRCMRRDRRAAPSLHMHSALTLHAPRAPQTVRPLPVRSASACNITMCLPDLPCACLCHPPPACAALLPCACPRSASTERSGFTPAQECAHAAAALATANANPALRAALLTDLRPSLTIDVPVACGGLRTLPSITHVDSIASAVTGVAQNASAGVAPRLAPPAAGPVPPAPALSSALYWG
jgi:hypothetical protein